MSLSVVAGNWPWWSVHQVPPLYSWSSSRQLPCSQEMSQQLVKDGDTERYGCPCLYPVGGWLFWGLSHKALGFVPLLGFTANYITT